MKRFTADLIEKDLPTRCVGRTCLVYDRVASTNDIARSILSDRRYDGLAVFANRQSRGRGRNGRTWQAQSHSSVLCSVLLRFDGGLSDLVGPVNLGASVAAASAVSQAFSIPVAIKWPNDLYVRDKKLGGILIEGSQVDRDRCGFVIGIGINVTQQRGEFPAALAERACSVATVLDRAADESDRVHLARQLLIELDRVREGILRGDLDRLRRDWLALAADREGVVTVEHEGRRFEGRIVDVDTRDHSLLIQDTGGLIWHLKPNVSRLVI